VNTADGTRTPTRQSRGVPDRRARRAPDSDRLNGTLGSWRIPSHAVAPARR
jgi:hypothetical protein